MRSVIAVAVILLLAACSAAPSNKERSPRDSAANYNVQLGLAYLQKGNLPVAKEKLERAEKQNPRDPQVHDALAMLYERLNEPKLVDSHFRTAVRLAPDNPSILNNYAVFLCRNGRTEEGVSRFHQAANNRLYETPEAAYTNAGVCLRAAKRYDEAEENFTRALRIRPDFAEAAYQLSDLKFDQGKPVDARAQIDRYLASFEATPELLLLGVRVAHSQGDRLAAERYARRLRVEFPDAQQTHAIPELSRNPG